MLKKGLKIVFVALSFMSCEDKGPSVPIEASNNTSKKSKDAQQNIPQILDTKEGKGGIALGGTMRIVEEETYTTLFPQTVKDLFSSQMITQIHDGLVKFNPSSLEIESALAESYNISDDT